MNAKEHWAWACVDCSMTGVVSCAPKEVGDTEDYARTRAEAQHRRRNNTIGDSVKACRNASGTIRVEKIPALTERIKNDASKAAARYDEIVKLRLFISDVESRYADELPPDLRARLLDDVENLSKGWGEEGDCV